MGYFAEIDGKVVGSENTLGELLKKTNIKFLKRDGGARLIRWDTDGYFQNNVNFSYTFDGYYNNAKCRVKIFFIQ